MKINVEVDCTPEEARRFMGLPDMSPVHEAYINVMKEAVGNPTNPEAIQQMFQNWNPVGDAGMNFWRTILDAGTKASK